MIMDRLVTGLLSLADGRQPRITPELRGILPLLSESASGVDSGDPQNEGKRSPPLYAQSGRRVWSLMCHNYPIANRTVRAL